MSIIFNFYCIKLFDDGIPQAILVDSKLVFELKKVIYNNNNKKNN